MKIFRLLLIIIFVFCGIKSFLKDPFEHELPLLLFPEKKAWLGYVFEQQDIGYNWDDRPLCLQTSFNYSELKPLLLPQSSELLASFKSEIVQETRNLGAKDWQLKIEEPKDKKKLIWPCRRIEPITAQLRFSVEKNLQDFYSFKTLWSGSLPGKNTFYCISDKNGWSSFIYKEEVWPIVKTFVQQTNIPIGITKIRQD